MQIGGRGRKRSFTNGTMGVQFHAPGTPVTHATSGVNVHTEGNGHVLMRSGQYLRKCRFYVIIKEIMSIL